MKKAILVLTILFTLASCSMLKDVAKGAIKGAVGGDGGGIELDTQIGDNETDVALQTGGVQGTGDVVAKDNAQVTVETKQIETQVEQAEQVTVNNDGLPIWKFLVLLIICLLFWELPRSSDMIKWVRGKFKKRVKSNPKRQKPIN